MAVSAVLPGVRAPRAAASALCGGGVAGGTAAAVAAAGTAAAAALAGAGWGGPKGCGWGAACRPSGAGGRGRAWARRVQVTAGKRGETNTRWDERWFERLADLEAFKEVHGHCNVPQSWEENPALGRWVNKQRVAYKRGELSPEREARLEALGMEWEAVVGWDDRFRELESFREEHGHCNVPYKWQENTSLGRWVSWQRRARRRGELEPELEARLEAMGFEWDLVVEWDERFGELESFRKEHGHCLVPFYWDENRQLGRWVDRNRGLYRQGELAPERVARLEAIGFEWEVRVDWEERVRELEAFKEVNGHCNVPSNWEEHPQLGRWVDNQRSARKVGLLEPEQEAKLNDLGFEWQLMDREAPWERRFRELQEFREQNGHCNVPEGWAPNPELAWWVGMQRKNGRLNHRRNLSDQRRARLDAVGFSWVGHESGVGAKPWPPPGEG